VDERSSQVIGDQQASEQRPTNGDGGQTRSKQTWILAGAILVAGFVAAFVPGVIERKEAYDRIYPGCWQLIGRSDQCEMRSNIHAFLRGA
jgi:hypothetical protein